MITLTLTRADIRHICNALDAYAQKAEEDAQWDEFVEELRTLNDRLFHLTMEASE